jgi:competence protein ComEC
VVTAGIVADRYAALPLFASMLVAGVSLAAWFATRQSRHAGLPLIYLGLTGMALGSAYHHLYREGYPPDDLGNYAAIDPRPVRLRGTLVEEPTVSWQVHDDPLQSFDRDDPTVTVLEAARLRQEQDWFAVSGKARLIVAGRLPGFHAGDEVEVVGRLTAPRGPANPGEFDYASFLRDQRIRAQVTVHKTADGVVRHVEGWPRSLAGWLGVVRGWGQGVLQRSLPAESSGVATALLLGEGSTMTNADWDKYIRTGVIHVLAISGQHLVVLGAFLWLALRLAGVSRRRGALGVALFLFAYALLTGGRPPVMRSAVTVAACCGAILLRRPSVPANSFALAWLIVIVLNPTDLFGSGCLLSFLSVAVLYWGTSPWFRSEPDPVERLVEESRPLWQRVVRRLARQAVLSYAVTLAIWLALIPLVASRYHLVSFAGILIGPPVVLLTSIALLSGFLLLMAAACCGLLVPLLGGVTHASLAACEWLVNAGDRLPLGHWYVGDVSEWWVWVFYAGLLTFLMLERLRRHGRWMAAAALVWLCVGLMAGWSRPGADELRCTFLAVGHGGCTVLETPDGRVLLYDAGTLAGPDVTRRQIAPFLWSRGIHRIDEVILSHADLDHFNGLPALLERFAVGQLSCTPTFADKAIPGVPVTLAALQRWGVPVRILQAGDRLSAGPVDMEVLHPPATGPAGRENFRSMVLLVRHGEHSLLLTGDLEGPGLARVLSLPLPRVDVLMAKTFPYDRRFHMRAVPGFPRPGCCHPPYSLYLQPRMVCRTANLLRG